MEIKRASRAGGVTPWCGYKQAKKRWGVLRAGLMIVALLCVAVVPFRSYAMLHLQPIMATLVPESGQNARVFRISNTGTGDIAVRIRITTREIDDYGEETRADASSQFTVFPSQAILKPGEIRMVRVSWRGGAVGTHERAYRFIAEQLPVDFSVDSNAPIGGGVTMQFRYNGALYVSPAGVSAKIEASVGSGRDGVSLVLRNSGTAHQIIREAKAVIRNQAGFEYTVPEAVLEGINGQNILAGGRRFLRITLPPELANDSDLRVVFMHKRE